MARHAPMIDAKPRDAIDRYIVRRTLGAGSTGIVYVAYDPALDREIAIKMLPQGARAERLRREAKALARLSHPNVVAVHDVGEHDGQVFVAMALVDGVNLREWLHTPREYGEVMRVLLAAGRGIVAAHTANLIHRDLVPESIFVAGSGEVMVGDFGLALDSNDVDTTEKSDQLRFCSIAREALRPLGARVERVLRRGMSEDPDERFPSMSELLAALQLPPQRWPWITGAGVFLVGAAIAITLVVTREQVASAESLCATSGTPAWNPLMRGALEASLRMQGNTPDALAELGNELERYATTWTAVRRETCIARVSGTLAPAFAAARDACLETRKTTFDVTVASLFASGDDVFATWKRVAMLSPPAACTNDDAARLFSAMDITTQIESALARAVGALDETRVGEADAALEQARPLAEQLDVLPLRVRAFALSARSFCIQAKTAEADRFLALALAGAERLRESEHAPELDEVFQARTECLYRRAHYAALEPLLVQRIASMQRRYGRDGLEEANLRQRLGLVYVQLDRADDAAREYNASRRIAERFVTADAGQVTEEEDRALAAMQKGDLDGAIAHTRRSVAMLTTIQHPTLARSLVNLGTLLDTSADWKGADASFTQAIDRIDETTQDVDLAVKRVEALESRGWVRLHLGTIDAAIVDLSAAIAGAERYQRADYLTSSQIGLGRAWVMKREYERAVRLLRTSLEPYKNSVNRSTYRVGIAQFAYAQALWETGDRVRARGLAREAEVAVTEALDRRRKNPVGRNLVPSTEAALATIARWRDEHR